MFYMCEDAACHVFLLKADNKKEALEMAKKAFIDILELDTKDCYLDVYTLDEYWNANCPKGEVLFIQYVQTNVYDK